MEDFADSFWSAIHAAAASKRRETCPHAERRERYACTSVGEPNAVLIDVCDRCGTVFGRRDGTAVLTAEMAECCAAAASLGVK
jgi:hypothetical protein